MMRRKATFKHIWIGEVGGRTTLITPVMMIKEQLSVVHSYKVKSLLFHKQSYFTK